MLRAWVAIVTVLLLAFSAARADCNSPAADPVTRTKVPGSPFSAIPSPDGCSIFVSVVNARVSQLVLMKRDNGTISIQNHWSVFSPMTGMALSPDHRFLAAATGEGVKIFDVAKIEAGADDVSVASSDDGPRAGSIYTVFTPDQHFLFVANESSASLSVYDVSGLPSLKEVARVPVGAAPVGLAVSPDGKYLYSTSEVGLKSWPKHCTTEGDPHPEGMLLVIDVAKASSDPGLAVVGGVAAGCNPVRVVFSPDHRLLYVTARGDNVLEVFDAAKLVGDGVHARVAAVPVGVSPVGVAAVGDRVIVANSDRFGGGNQFLSVLDAGNLTSGQEKIASGDFPRELNVTADGNGLVVTNYGSGDVELVDLRRVGK